MFKSQKNVFWEALVVTLFIFGIGVLLGVILENWRTSEISDLYQRSEVELLDIRLQNEIYSKGEFDCEFAMQENLKFANKIYEEAKILEKYESARRLTKNLIIQHKKYDLLRAMLFMNSIEIRQNCSSSYHNVIYFYLPEYENPRLDLKAKQRTFSKLLGELKQKQGDEVLLIPIAANKDVSSINILLNQYNISREDLPLILIDEEIKITELQKVEELEGYL